MTRAITFWLDKKSYSPVNLRPSLYIPKTIELQPIFCHAAFRNFADLGLMEQ